MQKCVSNGHARESAVSFPERVFMLKAAGCCVSDCVQRSAIKQLTDAEEHRLVYQLQWNTNQKLSILSHVGHGNKSILFHFPCFLSLHAHTRAPPHTHTHIHRWVRSSLTALFSIHAHAAIIYRKAVSSVFFVTAAYFENITLSTDTKNMWLAKILFFDFVLFANKQDDQPPCCMCDQLEQCFSTFLSHGTLF